MVFQKNCGWTNKDYFTVDNVYNFIRELLKEQKEKILKEIDILIAGEMLIAIKEGTPTSRLTSLANKINNLNK